MPVYLNKNNDTACTEINACSEQVV